MKKSLKSRFILTFFNLSSFFAKSENIFVRTIGLPIRILYKLLIEFIMSIEIPDKLKVGKNLTIYHGIGIVINAESVIGNNVTIRQNTTIGSKYDGGKSPRIGDNVDIGANVVIIGDITIGNEVVIGAGTVVTKSFPDNVTIVGNPARILNKPGSDNGLL